MNKGAGDPRFYPMPQAGGDASARGNTRHAGSKSPRTLGSPHVRGGFTAIERRLGEGGQQCLSYGFLVPCCWG